jgi:hypothetical protein
MRSVEELYDARYARDTADLREDADGNVPPAVTFPAFVYEFYTKRKGLRSLVDQCARELLYNVHAMRKDYLEVEVFARFLEVRWRVHVFSTCVRRARRLVVHDAECVVMMVA